MVHFYSLCAEDLLLSQSKRLFVVSCTTKKNASLLTYFVGEKEQMLGQQTAKIIEGNRFTIARVRHNPTCVVVLSSLPWYSRNTSASQYTMFKNKCISPTVMEIDSRIVQLCASLVSFYPVTKFPKRCLVRLIDCSRR